MRKFFLGLSLLLLICALCFLRSFRFEAVSEKPALSLADLKKTFPHLPAGATWAGPEDQPELRLRVETNGRPVSVNFSLDSLGAVCALQIRVAMSAHDLILGPNKWDSGRVAVGWTAPDSHDRQETDPIESLSGGESNPGLTVVARPNSGNAAPTLLIQNLGSAGELRIERLDLAPVRERPAWSVFRWGLAAAWLLWISTFLLLACRRTPVRSVLAASLWVLMGVLFAFPGPWKTLRPFVLPYEIGADHSTPEASNEDLLAETGEVTVPRSIDAKSPVSGRSPVSDSIPATEPAGRIPVQGGWIIQIKHHLSEFRPLLHVLLLMFPTLAFAIWVGPRCAGVLAAGLAIAIEAAQVGFGYSFDWLDVLDLVTDAIGIALGLWLFRRAKAKWPWFRKLSAV